MPATSNWSRLNRLSCLDDASVLTFSCFKEPLLARFWLVAEEFRVGCYLIPSTPLRPTRILEYLRPCLNEIILNLFNPVNMLINEIFKKKNELKWFKHFQEVSAQVARLSWRPTSTVKARRPYRPARRRNFVEKKRGRNWWKYGFCRWTRRTWSAVKWTVNSIRGHRGRRNRRDISWHFLLACSCGWKFISWLNWSPKTKTKKQKKCP